MLPFPYMVALMAPAPVMAPAKLWLKLLAAAKPKVAPLAMEILPAWL